MAIRLLPYTTSNLSALQEIPRPNAATYGGADPPVRGRRPRRPARPRQDADAIRPDAGRVPRVGPNTPAHLYFTSRPLAETKAAKAASNPRASMRTGGSSGISATTR